MFASERLSWEGVRNLPIPSWACLRFSLSYERWSMAWHATKQEPVEFLDFSSWKLGKPTINYFYSSVQEPFGKGSNLPQLEMWCATKTARAYGNCCPWNSTPVPFVVNLSSEVRNVRAVSVFANFCSWKKMWTYSQHCLRQPPKVNCSRERFSQAHS